MTHLYELKNIKTLLVDGDLMVRNSLGLAFKVSGCFLQTVGSGEEGLLELEKERFDIILFDFNLPGMKGLEFFRTAKVFHPNALYIITASWWNDELIREAKGLGIHGIIEKPFSIRTLSGTLLPLIKSLRNIKSKPDKSFDANQQIDMGWRADTQIQSAIDGKAVSYADK